MPTAERRQIVPAGVDERFVAVGSYRVRYLTVGSGPAMLLLHGLMASSFSWTEVILDLGCNFTVIAPDLLSFKSCDGGEVDPHLSAVAGRMLGFMDALHVHSATVIGSSHGGAVALEMALQAPQRIKRLVLVSPPHPWSETGRWQIKLFATAFGPPLARLMAVAPILWMPIGLCRLYARASRMRRGTIAGYSRLADSHSLAFLVKIVQTWQTDFAALRRRLPAPKVPPALVIWGDRDRIVRISTAAALVENLPGARYEVIRDCGHLPYEELPAEFLRIVHRFLAGQGQTCA